MGRKLLVNHDCKTLCVLMGDVLFTNRLFELERFVSKKEVVLELTHQKWVTQKLVFINFMTF